LKPRKTVNYPIERDRGKPDVASTKPLKRKERGQGIKIELKKSGESKEMKRKQKALNGSNADGWVKGAKGETLLLQGKEAPKIFTTKSKA